jgi:hypothetical protein
VSTEPENDGQSDLEAILDRVAPDPERRAEFLKSRLRLKEFNENDEILALANYLDTVVVLVDGLTGNLARANQAELGQDVRATRAAIGQLTEEVGVLKARSDDIKSAADFLMRISGHRILWGMVIAYVLGVLAYPLLDALIGWFRQLSHL